MIKVIFFYYLKDWYTLSYPVLFTFNQLKQQQNMLLMQENGFDIIDFKNFLSAEDIMFIDTSNRKLDEINYSRYTNKAFNNFMLQHKAYQDSILIGFHPSGFENFFTESNYSRLRANRCTLFVWQDDLHSLVPFPKVRIYDEKIDYSMIQNPMLDKTDLILTPSKIYYKNLKSHYLSKTEFFFYSLNEDYFKDLPIDNWNSRKNKILLSGCVSKNYKIRKEILDKLYKNYTFVDYVKSPGYDRTQEVFFDTVGLNYYKLISMYKGAFVGYFKYPLNYNLAKIIEILMCGTIGFFEFSPALETELGLIAFKHYVPITDANGELIQDESYYLHYLDSDIGEKIAKEGCNYVRNHFSSRKRVEQLIEIIQRYQIKQTLLY